jgi:hypothetical protein
MHFKFSRFSRLTVGTACHRHFGYVPQRTDALIPTGYPSLLRLVSGKAIQFETRQVALGIFSPAR